MPNVSDIPTASTLQSQLNSLNTAIAAIGAGAPVSNMTIQPKPVVPEGAPPGVLPMPAMPISIYLDPPMSDPDTLSALVVSLQAQADGITQQLVDLGYTPDPAADPIEGTKQPDKPDWWPSEVSWPRIMPQQLRR